MAEVRICYRKVLELFEPEKEEVVVVFTFSQTKVQVLSFLSFSICVFLSLCILTDCLSLNVEVNEVIRTEPIARHRHVTPIDGGNQFPRMQQISYSLSRVKLSFCET